MMMDLESMVLRDHSLREPGAPVFKNTQGGGNWNFFKTGLIPGVDTAIFTLAIDPLTPTTLYVGTNGGGVFGYRINQVLSPW